MRAARNSSAESATIYITALDRLRLGRMIDVRREHLKRENHDHLLMLEQELERAEVVEPAEVPGDVITMRSEVLLRDLKTSDEVTYKLVFPSEADPAADKISVLSPAGTAMLGYRVGDQIEWEEPTGLLRRLRVEALLYQPEAAGDYRS